jgi:opacity protein-like surface antigen
MKHLPLLLLVLLPTACAAVGAPQSDTPVPRASGNANRLTLYGGQRSFDEDDYEPVEDHLMLGLEYAHETPGSAVGFEVGVAGSGDDDDIGGVDVEARTFEAYAGLRKTLGDSAVHPYLAGGVSAIKADVELGGFDDDDTSFGVYLHGGVAFDLTESFSLGVDLRTLFGSEIEIAGIDGDADYAQFAVFAALGF